MFVFDKSPSFGLEENALRNSMMKPIKMFVLIKVTASKSIIPDD